MGIYIRRAIVDSIIFIHVNCAARLIKTVLLSFLRPDFDLSLTTLSHRVCQSFPNFGHFLKLHIEPLNMHVLSANQFTEPSLL